MKKSILQMRIMLILTLLLGSVITLCLRDNSIEIVFAITQIIVTIILGLVTYHQTNIQIELDKLDKSPYLKLVEREIKNTNGVETQILKFENDNSVGITNPKVRSVSIEKNYVKIVEIKEKDNKLITSFLEQCEKFTYTKPGDEKIIIDKFFAIKDKYSQKGLNEDLWKHMEIIFINQVFADTFSLCEIEHPLFCTKEDVLKIVAQDKKPDNYKSKIEELIHWYPRRIKILIEKYEIQNLTQNGYSDTRFDVATTKNTDYCFAIVYYSVFLYPYTQIIKVDKKGNYSTLVFSGIKNKISRKEFNKYFS